MTFFNSTKLWILWREFSFLWLINKLEQQQLIYSNVREQKVGSRIPQRFEIYWKTTRVSRSKWRTREWLSRAARFVSSLLHARSRAWNVLSSAYAFSPLKCWFESVFFEKKKKKKNIFLCFMVHWGVETTFLSNWVVFFKGMPPWLGFAMDCSSSVHQFPFSSCNNLTK